MQYADAKRIADQLVSRFAPYCERVEIAGSVRRGKAEVHDIDLLVLPKTITQRDCFDNPVGIESLFHPEEFALGEFKKNGPRAKQILLPEGIHLELWICLPPAQFGYLFAIRTGPADYSKWLVTPKPQGGALPSYLRVSDGAVWHGHSLVPTPTEEDFYKSLCIPWVEPAQRVPPTRLSPRAIVSASMSRS